MEIIMQTNTITFESLGLTPKTGKLTPDQIKGVKALGCLKDKRYDDIFNVD